MRLSVGFKGVGPWMRGLKTASSSARSVKSRRETPPNNVSESRQRTRMEAYFIVFFFFFFFFFSNKMATSLISEI